MNEIASRYGQALFSLALDNNCVISWQEEVKELKAIILNNDGFITLISSSFLSIDEKIDKVDQIFLGVDDNIKSLIKILIKNNRSNQLIDVFNAFNSYCNEYRGVDEGLVYSISYLKSNTLRALEEKISKIENCKVELINKIDPSLIGGIKVVIHDRVYDGSIKNQIEQMKLTLLK